MIKTEFGIIECFDNGEYVIDESMKLVYIDDDKYIDDWWNSIANNKNIFS